MLVKLSLLTISTPSNFEVKPFSNFDTFFLQRVIVFHSLKLPFDCCLLNTSFNWFHYSAFQLKFSLGYFTMTQQNL